MLDLGRDLGRTLLVLGVGGGTDPVSGLDPLMTLVESGRHILLGNTHEAEDLEKLRSKCITEVAPAAFRFEYNSAAPLDGRARLSEVIVGHELNIPTVSFFTNLGAIGLRESLLRCAQFYGVDTVVTVDGGGDSLATYSSAITSIVTDAIALTALFHSKLRWPYHYLIGGTLDGEHTVDSFRALIGLASEDNALLGSRRFPLIRVPLACELLSIIRTEMPGYVSDLVVAAALGQTGPHSTPYGFQRNVNEIDAWGYLIKPAWIQRINPFTSLVANTLSSANARGLIAAFLDVIRPDEGPWESNLFD